MPVTKFQEVVKKARGFLDKLAEMDFDVLQEAARLADTIETLKEQEAQIKQAVEKKRSEARGEIERMSLEVGEAKNQAALSVRQVQSEAAGKIKEAQEMVIEQEKASKDAFSRLINNFDQASSDLESKLAIKRADLENVESQLASAKEALVKIKQSIGAL